MSAATPALGSPLGDALQKAGDSATQQLQQLAAPASSARDKAQDLADQAQQQAQAAED